MKFTGEKYSLEFGEHLESYTSWCGGGHYEEKEEQTNYSYKDSAILKDNNTGEKYCFDFGTNTLYGNQDLGDKVLNTGNIEVPEKGRRKLVDLISENILKEIKEHKNGFRAYINFYGQEIERDYLEENGIITETDGQSRIVFG